MTDGQFSFKKSISRIEKNETIKRKKKLKTGQENNLF